MLGPHHGIIYRRAELKELIAMHSNGGQLGGDLKTDTVTIIGGALDLQEKVSGALDCQSEGEQDADAYVASHRL